MADGFAATDTATFAVTATVEGACRVSVSEPAFGTFNALSGSNVDATSALTATCTNGSAYTVALNAGLGASATPSSPQMMHASDTTRTLDYSLSFLASGAADRDASGGRSMARATGNGMGQSIIVYRRVPRGQTTPLVGAYRRTVTATIDF